MRTNLLLKAWEAGFALCRIYGDNYAHFAGAQKARHWAAFLATIPSREDGAIMEAAKALVMKMNPHEARRFPEYVRDWPDWARADWSLAYHALIEAADGLPARHTPEEDPVWEEAKALMGIRRARPPGSPETGPR